MTEAREPVRSAAVSIPRDQFWNRVAAVVIGAGLLSVLTLAAFLTPSGSGYGTHRQLGLPECGWMIALGKPCPTCGMTTSFAHAAHGHLGLAGRAQPMGMVLALAAAAGFWVCVHVAWTGSRIGALCGTLLRPRVMWLVAAATALAWAYKLYTHGAPGAGP